MASPWSWTPGPPFNNSTFADPSHVWNRKFWGPELIYARSGLATPGRTDIMLACTVVAPPPPSLAPPLTHAYVRAALRTLRFQHPSLASQIVWDADHSDGRVMYEAPASEAEVDAWLDEVVLSREAVDGGMETAIAMLRSELGHADAVRTRHEFKVYHIAPAAEAPQVHGILMYFKHALFDGLASWQTLDLFLKELAWLLGQLAEGDAPAPLAWGTEFSRLARPVADRVSQPWSPADLHIDWPMIKRMNQVLERPSTNFGIPIIHPNAPDAATEYIVRSFPKSMADGLISAARKRRCKLFSVQLASILITCLRLRTAPSQGEGAEEARVTLPYNPVNLRPRLSTHGGAELIIALGFSALDARDLMRFSSCSGGDRETQEAVWTLAGELQAQLAEMEPWHEDTARYAPMVLRTLGEHIFTHPPPATPLRAPGMTNFGVLDSVLQPSYPINIDAKTATLDAGTYTTPVLEVTHASFHTVLFHCPATVLPAFTHIYSWRGVLYYSHSYSAAHMGVNAGEKEEGMATLAQFIDELEVVTRLLVADGGV